MKIRIKEKVGITEFLKEVKTQDFKNQEFTTQFGNTIYIHDNGDITINKTIRNDDTIEMERNVELTEDTPVFGLVLHIYHETFNTTDAFFFNMKQSIQKILDVHDDSPDARCLAISYRDAIIWTHHDGIPKCGQIYPEK